MPFLVRHISKVWKARIVSKLPVLLVIRFLSARTMAVKEYANSVISSTEDKRKYRGLVLQNDMKVMLISDSTTDKSAAALDVHVGCMSDPIELPGLAHFCEHMLSMGTEKYPSENEYCKYLSEHGGGSNAYTGTDHTNFYFDVTPEAFHGALDRFAQSFLSPLFTESAVDREVRAVNSEHEKNLQNDYWRLAQLERSTSNPTHDFNKFGTGNLETLDYIPKQNGINVRNALLEFHKKWYSANIMALTILGKESLDELEEMVVGLFRDVENEGVEVPCWEEHPMRKEECQKLIYVSPVKDIRNLNITFPIPDLRCYYKAAVGHYLGHLIGHEGPGSLLSYLKSKGWVNTLVGGQKLGARGFSFFVVHVDLTEEGIKHVEDIVMAVFQYLKLVKEEGLKEWLFEEFRDISAINFRFKDKERPQSYVSFVSEQLHYYPLAEVLSADYVFSEYRPDLIMSVLDHLTPENLRVTVIGKALEDKVDQKEKWYGTLYKLEDIDSAVLQQWKNVNRNPALHLPNPNEFIPSDFQLYRHGEGSTEVPVLITETPLYRTWYKLDEEFNLPKAVLFAELFSKMAYLDPHHTNLLHMFVQLFKDALTEYVYDAELAGVCCTLGNTKYGLTLNIQGFNDKQEVLLNKVMEKLTSFQVDAQRFEILKDEYLRELRNFAADQPHQHLVYYTSLLLSEQGWSKEELLGCTDELTAQSLQSFIPQFLSNLHLEFLVHGNISSEEAEKLCHIVIDHLMKHNRSRPLLPSQLNRQREYSVPAGSSFVFRAENGVHTCSAVENFYQFGTMDTSENMLSELLVQILNEPAFDELRTKEQLGYMVWCGLRRSNGTQGLRLIIQGEKSPEYLDSRIEAFLQKMRTTLDQMPHEEFQRHKDALAKHRLERPKRMAHLTFKWWNEIMSNQYHFHRDKVEVAHLLENVTKADVISYFEKCVVADAAERKKLSVQVLSVAPGGAGDTATPQTSVVLPDDDGLQKPPSLPELMAITSIPSFKAGLPLFSLMKPYIPITKESKSKL